MKYRKKPVVVEARQWVGHMQTPNRDVAPWYYDWAGNRCPVCGLGTEDHGRVKTLEGCLRVCPGDWIICGIKGELYPYKPDIFAMTYEEVTDD